MTLLANFHHKHFTVVAFLLTFWSLFGCSLLQAAPQDRQQLARAENLQSQVLELFSAGKFREAIPVAQQVLRIWETELGPLHSDVAAAYSNLGEIHRRLGDLAKAKPLHERSLKIRERTLGQNHADTATSATYVAMIHEAQGDDTSAEKRYRQALKIRKSVFGSEHPEVASALNNIGSLLKTQSKTKQAEVLFKQGLAIRRKTQGATHPDSAPSLDNLAQIYEQRGQFADAEPLYQQALKIRETHSGKEHPDTAITLNNLAALYDKQSRHTEAEPLFLRALQIREKSLGVDHPLTAATVSNLGGLRERRGDFSGAEEFYQRALRSLKKSVGSQHIQTGIITNNLASLYRRQQRYDSAEPLFIEALRIFENKLGPEHRNTAQVLNNLGGLREIEGDFPTAERHYRRSLKIRRKVLGERHPDTAESVNNLALLLAASHKVAEAIPLLKQSLAVRMQTLGDEHPTTVDALNNLASYEEQQQVSGSIDHFELARRGIRGYVVDELPALSASEQSLFLKVNYERGFHQALSCAALHADKRDVVEKSAGWLLNGKAVGRAALAQKNLAQRANPSNTKPARWVDLSQLRKAIPEGSVFVDFARFEVFDFELRPGAATWLPARYAAWVTPADGAGDVQFVDIGPADQIDDLIREVRKQFIRAHGKDGEFAASSEQEAVSALGKTLQSLADRVWKPLAPLLGDSEEIVLSPDGDLWLLPWAALPVGPTDAFGDRPALIEKFSLNLVVSGRDLTRKDTAEAVRSSVILANPQFDQETDDKEISIKKIFNEIPQADEGTLRSFSAKFLFTDVQPLPNTEIEAISIEPQLEIYSGEPVRVFKQQYALESVVKKMRGPKVVVFATHGFFLPREQLKKESTMGGPRGETRSLSFRQSKQQVENPLLRCGLLLSGCNQQGTAIGNDDGILTGAEVTGVDLRGTELVVLSACETGIGEVNRGEGVAGLRQAFQLAGAESVVASLWQVSDRETALLISDFFRNLASGQTKAKALQNAQLTRIKKRRERYGAAHPFYWAAFTITGR
ncbi:MAG: CHAT domain-containing tetratricopeptide repeat protein [Fuerstiella sp.]